MDFKPFKIGKYLLLERLATGGMAEVYRAKASGAGGFEKQLAIKRILPTYSQNEEFRRMFEYEARLSSMLTHANIVQVYDFVKSGDTYLLAMEYVDGKNLRQFVNKARKVNLQLPLAFAAYIVNEVCKGLEYAHGKKDDLTGKPLNIIHRDMSPQNVMLSYDGAVKIVDFGIAKAKDRVDETRSGVIKGKFGYMSPEQANGLPIDHRSDIFSTGIILFELISGRRLFAAENDMATLKLIQECIIPAPTRINPKIPAEFEKITLKALTKDLNLRYQNAGNFHRNLQAFLSKHFPNYTQKDAADTISMVFRQEIEAEKKRLEQLHRQSIPFSQGAREKIPDDWGGDPEPSASDGEVTKSDARENTPATFVDEISVGDNPVSKSEGMPDASKANEEPQDSVSEATRVDGSVSNLDPASIDSLLVSDESVATVGSNAKTGPSPTKGGAKDEKTVQGKRPQGIGQIVQSGGGSFNRTNPSVTPRSVSATTNRGRTAATPSQEDLLVVRNDDNDGRRRERSISALTEVSGTEDKAISIGGVKEPSAPTPMRRESFYAATEDEYRPRRKSRLGTIAFFSLIAIATAYGYRLYLEGGFPRVIAVITSRTKPPDTLPDRDPQTDPNPGTDPNRPKGDCLLEVTTDPGGARVYVNDRDIGTSAATISGPCNTSARVRIEMNGFQTVNENIVFRGPLEKIYKTLKRVSQGELELTLSQNAQVYVDGKLFGEASANQMIKIPLRANSPHKIRFVNKIFGIDTIREYTVEVDSVLQETVRLEGN